MAKMKCTFTKATPGAKKAAPPHKVGDPLKSFNIEADGQGNFLVQGRTNAGNLVDISAVATLDPPPVSSDFAVLDLSATGMTFKATLATPAPAVGATALTTVTAHANDGSFSYPMDLELKIVTPGIAGIDVSQV